MVDYMASLEKLAARGEDLYFSGHGPEIPDAPRYVRFLIRHRQAREASILHRLAKGEADIPTIVRAIYIGIDPRLMNAAGYSVLAHLEDLVGRGIVATDGDPVIGGSIGWRIANSEWEGSRGAALLFAIRYSPLAPSLLHYLRRRLRRRGRLLGRLRGSALSAALLRSSISLRTRAALLPRSLSK